MCVGLCLITSSPFLWVFFVLNSPIPHLLYHYHVHTTPLALTHARTRPRKSTDTHRPPPTQSLFYLNKLHELFDTVVLILRGKEPNFLQVRLFCTVTMTLLKRARCDHPPSYSDVVLYRLCISMSPCTAMLSSLCILAPLYQLWP